MPNAKPMNTLMTTGLKLTGEGDAVFHDPSLYRSIVEGLQYITITRPKLSFAVNKVCQYMHSPKDHHQQATKYILRYLAGRAHYGLQLQPSSALHISAFCDSEWGSNVDDCKSTSGYCIYLGSNIVSCSSKKQHVVSRSSTEAEYRSISYLGFVPCYMNFSYHIPDPQSSIVTI